MNKQTDEIKDSKDDMFCAGTIGHVDHGKTTLTAAISKFLANYGLTKQFNKLYNYDDIDSGKEEKARGITINSAHVRYQTLKRVYAHVDCPGHADYIKNMITGSSQMEGVILVVSAEDGVMPQTKEHLNLIAALNPPSKDASSGKKMPTLVIYINKADLVNDQDIIDLVKEEILEEVARLKYDHVPKVIVGSAYLALTDNENEIRDGKLVNKNTGLEVAKDSKLQLGLPSIFNLLQAMDSMEPRPKQYDAPFKQAVSDSLTIPGRGTVTTGIISQGTIKVGDEVEIIGSGAKTIKTVVTSIEIFNTPRQSAKAGEDVALLLRGVDKNQVVRGDTIVAPGSAKAYNKFTALIYAYSKEENGRVRGFQITYKPQFYIRVADTTGKFLKFHDDIEMVNPGEWSKVDVEIEKKLVILPDEHFVIRESGKTVAAGTILNIIE